MRGDPIPNDDNVLRYARPNLVDGDDVDGGAFQKRVRDGEVEEGLSSNWIEAFAGLDKNQQISEIRRLFRLSVKKNGRFAELPVGATIEAVLDEIDGLTIEEDPLEPDEENGHEADPSHALICGAPDPTTDAELAETVGDMIAACVTELHPATTEQAATN